MRRNKNYLLVSLCLTLLAGCSTFRRQPTKPSVPGAETSPTRQWPEPLPTEPEAPPQAPHSPRQVAVILGPGAAKALAHAGVLKELQRAKIPVGRVIGLEWGALPAALFAQRGQSNEMDWKLYKIEKQSLPAKGFLSNKLKTESISVLRPYLSDSFARQDLTGAAIPFSCPVAEADGVTWRWQTKGDMAEAVESCLAYPPLFTAARGQWAGAFAARAAVERARREGSDLVIFVNVLNTGPLVDAAQLPDSTASAILWQEIRRNLHSVAPQVDEWIEVDTRGVSLGEFLRRRELVEAGEKSGRQAARRLTDKYGF